MKYWIDLEITKRTRLEIDVENRDKAEELALSQDEATVSWQRTRRNVETMVVFAPLEVEFYDPPFVMKTPIGFSFSKAAHEACERIVFEVCGQQTRSWNGFTGSLGCGTLSVEPARKPTAEQIQKVIERVRAEVTTDMLTLLVLKEIPPRGRWVP